MAIRLYCDATDRPIPEGEPDAGAGPMLVTTEEGYTVRVEVLPDAEGERPNLLMSALKKMIANGELVPEDEEAEEDAEDGTVRLPVERRG